MLERWGPCPEQCGLVRDWMLLLLLLGGVHEIWTGCRGRWRRDLGDIGRLLLLVVVCRRRRRNRERWGGGHYTATAITTVLRLLW